MPSALLLTALLVLGFSPAQAATREEIKSVAEELVCLCGNCSRESLATCVCTDFAVPERETIGSALDQGQTRQQVIDGFIARFGSMGLASPPSEGFNLLAWIAPGAVLLFGIALVRTLLVNWKGRDNDEVAQASSARADRSQYQDRLRRELDQFDDDDK